VRPPQTEVFTVVESPAFRANRHPDLFWAAASPPGRFNFPAGGPTQYLSAHPLGPMAERLRAAERYLGWPVDETDSAYLGLQLHVWTLKLSADYIFDLTFDTASRVGLSAEDLVSEDYTAAQKAGETYGRNDAEFPKVWRYPSAALPGTNNFVIFGGRWISAYDLPPTSAVRIPACVVATKAAPPIELSAVMRHFRALHGGLECHRQGARFSFEQPLSFAIHSNASV
jgi:hypothetical protein